MRQKSFTLNRIEETRQQRARRVSRAQLGLADTPHMCQPVIGHHIVLSVLHGADKRAAHCIKLPREKVRAPRGPGTIKKQASTHTASVHTRARAALFLSACRAIPHWHGGRPLWAHAFGRSPAQFVHFPARFSEQASRGTRRAQGRGGRRGAPEVWRTFAGQIHPRSRPACPRPTRHRRLAAAGPPAVLSARTLCRCRRRPCSGGHLRPWTPRSAHGRAPGCPPSLCRLLRAHHSASREGRRPMPRHQTTACRRRGGVARPTPPRQSESRHRCPTCPPARLARPRRAPRCCSSSSKVSGL